MNLTKKLNTLYTEDYKLLIKEDEEDTYKQISHARGLDKQYGLNVYTTQSHPQVQ